MSQVFAGTRDSRRSGDRSIWLPPVSLLVGLGLFCLAAPRLANSVLSASLAGVSVQGKTTELSREVLDQRIERQVKAVSWRPTPENTAVLSALSDVQARRIGYLSPEARPSLQRVSAAARVSLLLSPVNPYVWARLAQAEMLMSGPGQYPAQAVRLSILSARYPRELLADRLLIGLLLWGVLDNDTRGLVLDQITLAQRTMPWVLPRVAQDSAQPGIIRVALATDPEALVRFDREFGSPQPGGR